MDLAQEENRRLLEDLKGKTEYLKYLGSYQKGGGAATEAEKT
jgi:hypothetical protein